MPAETNELPFSARYSLPAQVADNLGEVSWETVAQLSSEFQVRSEEKSSKVKKILKELQMTRLLLMDRIKHGSKDGQIAPQLLVDIVKLLQRCEEVAGQYDIDLQEFSSYLYLVSEKLKKEKLAKYTIRQSRLAGIVPIKEELDHYKQKSEPAQKKRRKKRK